MDRSQPGSSVQGIFQARILEWVAISFSRGSSWPRDWTQVSCIVGRHFTIWATREAAFCLWGFTCLLDRGNFFQCSSKSQHLLSVYYVLGNVGNYPVKSAIPSPCHRWENKVREILWHLWKHPRITEMSCELQGSIHILINFSSGSWPACCICQPPWELWDDGCGYSSQSQLRMDFSLEWTQLRMDSALLTNSF